ncbi:MAG: radical SAM protein [Bacteroidales bacterium]|nr:radical SAM protein [Bacteroidales bacterium]
MFWEKTVFGPIHSRRLGSSLGINLLPKRGKFCNFDCLYCECGLNADGTQDRTLPEADEVLQELEKRLSELKAAGEAPDSITFSGDGEPTLHPEFLRIMQGTVALRDRFFPNAKVSVLSNATTLGRPGVAEALQLADNPIMKLDAPTDALARVLNRPSGTYSVRGTIEALKVFGGNFILQTMFLKAPGFDSSEESQLSAWMDIVRELRPREVMVYTLDRPAPVRGLEKFSADQMKEMTAPLAAEGYRILIRE